MGHAAQKQPSYMTVDSFLSWSDGADTRYELVGGDVLAMAPPTEAHGVIAANLIGEIRSKLKRPCRVVSEAGVRCPWRNDTCYQADIVITCLPPIPNNQLPIEPVVILEVLSASTAAHDRGTKVPDYRQISSVQEIVLVSSTEIKVEIWRRTASGWEVADVMGTQASFVFASMDIKVHLAAIYEGVAFEPEMNKTSE